MKQIIVFLSMAVLLLGCNSSEWKLVWEDDFNGQELDSTVWSRTTRAPIPWASTQSSDSRLVELKDGILHLKGMINDRKQIDTVEYITGGVVSAGKKSFGDGRIVIRAKINDAQGAWPALWMMPFDPSEGWPKGGEIDILERLNSDPFIYQTIHSSYSHAPEHDTNEYEPRRCNTSAFNVGEFNEFGLDMYEDSLVFHINGQRTFFYPRLKPEVEGQFPFFKEFYLLMDMQLGGSWAGVVNPDDLPVSMDIDWVRFYKKKRK